MHAVAGLYWTDGEAAGAGNVVNGGVFFAVTSGAVWTRTHAVYADATWDMTAHTSAELGLRYTHEDKRAAVITRVTDPTFQQTFGFRAYFTDATAFKAFSPRIALTWKPSDAATYYVQATRGFKGGTYNIRADTVVVPASALPLQDETATSLELGAKAQWRDGRITLNTALFHNDYRDIQLTSLVPFDSNGDGVDDDVFGDFRNAGQGTMQGVELEASARTGEHLRVLGHVAYLDARYDEYISGGVDISATARFPNAPDWTAGASAIGEWPLPGGSTFDARLDASFQGALYPTSDIDPSVLQPGRTLWNASLTWRSPKHDWEVALIGQNLSDKVYRTGSFWLPYSAWRPRTTARRAPSRCRSRIPSDRVRASAADPPRVHRRSSSRAINAANRGSLRRLSQTRIDPDERHADVAFAIPALQLRQRAFAVAQRVVHEREIASGDISRFARARRVRRGCARHPRGRRPPVRLARVAESASEQSPHSAAARRSLGQPARASPCPDLPHAARQHR